MPQETIPETAYVFAPIVNKSKDAKTGHITVTGKITGPDLDLDGQRVDPEWAKTAVPKWFEIGNIREMHLPVAVGKAQSIKEEDDGWYMSAKIVDRDAVEKVEEGIYTGFSIGIKRPVIDTTAKALTQAPGGIITGGTIIETSLADRACNESCKLVLAKAALPNTDVVAVAGVKPEDMLDKGLVRTEEIVDVPGAITPGLIADGHADLVKATTTGGHIHEHTHEDGAHTHAHAHSPLPGHHDHGDDGGAPPHSHAHDPKDSPRMDATTASETGEKPDAESTVNEDAGSKAKSGEPASERTVNEDAGKAAASEELARMIRAELEKMAAEKAAAPEPPKAAPVVKPVTAAEKVAAYEEAKALLVKAGKIDLTKAGTDHTAAYKQVIEGLSELISQEAAEMAGGEDEFACLARLLAAYKWLQAFLAGEKAEGEMQDVGSSTADDGYTPYVPTPYLSQAATPDLVKTPAADAKETDVDTKLVLAEIAKLTEAVKPVERIEALAGEMAEVRKTVDAQAATITAQAERLERIEKTPAPAGAKRAVGDGGDTPASSADAAKEEARKLMKLAGNASNPTLAEGYRQMAADALKVAGLTPADL